ncbi:MAG: methyltransferase [Pseudomonadota bacterium]
MTWNPEQYAKFAGPRLQPGLDLLHRLPADAPVARAVDLGCGTGELTVLLAQLYPNASIVGLDSSPSMLEKARSQFPDQAWLEADIAHWQPDRPIDLIFSNAVLHWLPDHGRLLTTLVSALAEGGMLAVQMPRNYGAHSHRLMHEVADQPRFAGRTDLRAEPVADPGFYDALLSPLVDDVEVWETEYWHRLTGDEPVFEWVKGTGLRPVLQALEGEDCDAFLTDYRRRLLDAYPKRDDGITLFPFRRLFLLARR